MRNIPLRLTTALENLQQPLDNQGQPVPPPANSVTELVKSARHGVHEGTSFLLLGTPTQPGFAYCKWELPVFVKTRDDLGRILDVITEFRTVLLACQYQESHVFEDWLSVVPCRPSDGLPFLMSNIPPGVSHVVSSHCSPDASSTLHKTQWNYSYDVDRLAIEYFYKVVLPVGSSCLRIREN